MSKRKIFYLFLMNLLNSQKSFAGNGMGFYNENEPTEHGLLYWVLFVWFFFWVWLSNHFAAKNKKIADMCGYICLGVPFVVLLLLIVYSLVIQIFKI